MVRYDMGIINRFTQNYHQEFVPSVKVRLVEIMVDLSLIFLLTKKNIKAIMQTNVPYYGTY